MRVISQYRGYEGITARKEISEPTFNGETKILQTGLKAAPFRYGDVTEWERIEAARQWPTMHGLKEGEEPVWRLSSFDTDEAQALHGWTDEERIIVEEALRAGPGAGSDYIIVEQPRVPAPYPKYDAHRKVQGRRTLEHVVTDIRAVYESAGFDVGQALAYERENGNDQLVLTALEGLGVLAESDDELVEA